MTRRGKLEVMYDILKAIYKGRRRITHITYGANMNRETLDKYIKRLIDRKQVTYSEPFYDITEKGIKYIKMYNAIIAEID